MSASSSRACLRSLRCSRAFSTSTPSRDLVGPPDPVSNLRPVIYDELPMPQAKPGQNTSRALAHRPHPYSLNEFTSTARETTRDDYGAYQLRMKQQELDAFNHAYWTETNTRFEAAKASVLASLPNDSAPEAKEVALSQFYRNWVRQEASRSSAYNKEWNKRNWSLLALGARVRYRELRARFGL